jgi:hypothetical protein
MNLLLLLPIFACITCCMLSAAILSRGTRHRASRLGAAMTLAAAFWALCEILWSTAHDPQTVIRLVRLAALGWVPIGPITLHLFLELTGHPARRRRGLLRALYGTTAVLLLMSLATPWLDVAAVKTRWGWSYQLGPMFPVVYLFSGTTFSGGLLLAIRDFRASVVPAERRQAHVLLAGMLVCLGIASVTDGVLPALGHHVPRLGVGATTSPGSASCPSRSSRAPSPGGSNTTAIRCSPRVSSPRRSWPRFPTASRCCASTGASASPTRAWSGSRAQRAARSRRAPSRR